METAKTSDVRVYNRKRIVNTLFQQGAMTRQELIGKLNISLTTANLLLKELTAMGLVTDGERVPSTGGRKPVTVAPIYDARYAIGADTGCGHLRIVLLDLGNTILAKECFPLPFENTAGYWQSVDRLLSAFVKKHVPCPEKLLKIGITLDTPMQHGKVVHEKGASPEEWIDLELASSCLTAPVSFRNSTKMAAIANVWTQSNFNSFIYLSMDHGLSGTLVYQSYIMDPVGVSGAFGSVLLPENGRLLRAFDGFPFPEAGPEAPLPDSLMDRFSVFLHNIYCIFGWPIVLGGSLALRLTPYREQLERRIRALYVFEEPPEQIISISSLGEYDSAVGAAMLPIDHFLEMEPESAH